MNVLRILTLIGAAVAVYANTLAVPFVFHDRAMIESNLRIRELWPGPLTAAQPVLEWSYALNYALGGLSVVGYHVANLLLHVACGLLLYDVIRRSLRLSRTATASAGVVAWWAALVFLVHPLQTEAVTLVSGRSEVLTAFWYLAMLELVLLGEESAGRRVPFWLAAIGACALGMGTGFAMVTAPLAVLWLGRYVLPRPRAPYVAFGDEAGEVVSARPMRWPLYAGVLATWGILAWLIVERVQPGAVLNVDVTPLEYLRTQLSVTWHYLGLLVWPVGQSIDYEWALTTPWRAPAFGWAVVVLLLGWLAASGRRGAAFWLGFALLALVPTSTLVPLTDMVVERRMYLTVGGFAVLVALAASGLARHTSRPVMPLVVVAVVVALASTAVGRNHVWRDPILLWGDALSKAPAKERVFRELAGSYARRGDRVRAARVMDAERFALERALASGGDSGVRVALSRVYGRMGRISDALAVARDAVRLAPTDPAARATLGALLLGQARLHDALAQLEIAQALVDGRGKWVEPEIARAVCTNLGWAYAGVGRSEKALEVLRRAAKDDDVAALNTLGSILGLLGEWEEARKVLERANAKDPRNTHVSRNLGWVYGNIGRFSEANALLKRAIVEQPNETRTHEDLGWLRLRSGRPAEALQALLMAAALEPRNADVHTLLGIARAQVGEWAGAMRAFERAVRLAPRSPLARENLNRARRRQPPLLPAVRPRLSAIR